MSDFKDYKDIWVFVEINNDEIKNVGLELLAPGKILAEKIGEDLVAIIIGKETEKAATLAIEYGANKVIVVKNDLYEYYETNLYTYVMEKLVQKYKPSTLLIGATNNGRDLGPRIACRLKTGLTADCTEISIDEESGNIAWTRPAFGGNLMATILCPESRPQIGTVRPGVYKKNKVKDVNEALVIEEDIKVNEEIMFTKLIKLITRATEKMVDLSEAEIIVSCGRGIGKPENIQIIQDLADAIGGSVGASRAVIDSGWLDYFHQVGQTGKTVQPKIYIACGISGAIQHLAGMSSSDLIIAINSDPYAPIFEIADYGIVGDILEIVPSLTKKIKEMK